MNKCIVLIAFLFFGIHSCVAQKILEKEFAAAEIHTVRIADDAIFKIKIIASERESIKLKVYISGEQAEAIIIEENILNGTLSLKTAVMPYFTVENDKLAAHKVMAVEVDLEIPENISIEIKSKLASLETSGNIQNLAVSLQNGTCNISSFLGNAHLKTETANIIVLAKKGVAGRGTSKNGIVENSLLKQGEFFIQAESSDGNIYLLQTE